MEGLVPIAIWLTLAMIVVGLLVIAIFGAKGLVSGKHRPWSIGAMLLPVVIFGISYAISAGGPDPAAHAGILTMLVLLFAGLAAVVVTGLKGILGF